MEQRTCPRRYPTNLIFGGLNFICDLSKPEGERIRISGFANGRPFYAKGLYLVATTDYLLGNDKCGLREFGLKDAIWFQSGDSDHDHIQDIIAEYIEDQCGENGSLTPDAFSWKWSLEYSEDPGALPASDKAAAASLKSSPREGHTYVIYSESERCLPTAEERDGSLLPAALEAYGEILPAPLPEDTLLVTAHAVGSGQWTFTDPEGRYLSCKAGGGLQLTAEESADAYSRWILKPGRDGWHILSAGGDKEQNNRLSLEIYKNKFSTFSFGGFDYELFNFYEITGKGQ